MTGSNFMKTVIALLILIVFSGCQYEKVEKISPVGTQCDTSNVSYKDDIREILKSQCGNCHTSGSPDGGYRLDNYEGVKASSSRLVGVVKHSSGFSAMPKGGNKMDDCSIQKIEKWVQEGAQDN
jgi:mono/diheme cytochrome c family protein